LLARLGWFLAFSGALLFLFVASFYVTMRLVFVGREVAVPDLTGLSIDQARETLNRSELYLETVAERHDDHVEKDHVAAQNPMPGVTIKKSRKVRVTISLGPLRVAIPDLTEQTVRTAQIALQREGLATGHVCYSHETDVAPDIVMAQEPPPSEPSSGVESASTGGSFDGKVNLLVSRGQEDQVFVMPDLSFRRLEEVQAMASRSGLRLGAVRRQRVAGAERGTVLRQYPQAGYPVSRRDIISLVLGE
jgi:serine/threonine-protein kinase